jgi:hypothetical protein
MPFLRFAICVTVLTLGSGGVLVALLNHTASDARAEQPANVEPGKLQVEFTKGAVVLNGTKLTIPFQRKDLVKLLGNPDREAKLANTILTWDELGIHAYQTLNKEEINALQVTFDRQRLNFTPKKLFSGSLKVEGAPVTAESTVEAINRAIKPAAFQKAFGDSWQLQYDQSTLYLQKADSKTKSDKANLSSVQIAKKEPSK